MRFFDRFRKKNDPGPSVRPAAAGERDADPVVRFYNDCVGAYHTAAKEMGAANRGVILIPELLPIGEKTILAFLEDPFFQTEFGGNPQMYHYVIMSLSIQAGIVFAAKWHEGHSDLDPGYVDRIIREGPAEACRPYLKQLGLTDSDRENAFYQAVFDRRPERNGPYRKMKDPRAYTFSATLAAYQLGISMMLEKYGF